MFTGIVEGLGKISSVSKQGAESRFVIEPMFAFENPALGESIAVNGACLSVEKFAGGAFTAYASAETMSLTNLGELKIGDKVNLERALQVGGRLGGHIVSGHIDCIAIVEKMEKSGESIWLTVSYPQEYAGQVISKGSVALNGISLTINKCGDTFLEVNVIPDSQKRTNFSSWRPGSSINMETDLMGKYAQHLLEPWQKVDDQARVSGINFEFLAKNGFV